MRSFFNAILISCVFYVVKLVVVSGNHYAESGNSDTFRKDEDKDEESPSHNHHPTNDGAICLNRYQVNADTIIRTQDSKILGAKYMNETELPTKEDCLLWCCQVSGCNVAVFEEKDKGSCYLFDCGPPLNFKCKFTAHNRYTSAILDTSSTKSEGRGKPGSIPKPSPPPADEHIVALKNLRHETRHQISSMDDNGRTGDHNANEVTSPSSVQSKVNAEDTGQRPTGQMTVTTTTTISPKSQLEATKIADSMTSPQKQTAAESQLICSHFQFQCRSSGECIAIYNACDGIPQCRDGSDESSELGCPTGDGRRNLGQTTQEPPVPSQQTKHSKLQPSQHKGSDHETEPRVSDYDTKENNLKNHQEPFHEHIQDSRNHQTSQNYEEQGNYEQQQQQHGAQQVSDTKPSRGSNRYETQEENLQESHHRNGGIGGTLNVQHNNMHSEHDTAYDTNTSPHQHGTILYAPKEPILDNNQEPHKHISNPNYLNAYNVPSNPSSDDSNPIYLHDAKALSEDIGHNIHTNPSGPVSKLDHQGVDHNGRRYYDNMPTSYDSDHSIDSESYPNTRYGGGGGGISPPSRGGGDGGYVREFYEGGYAIPENEYQGSYQPDGQYADHQSLHPYHHLNDHSESQVPLNPVYTQNAYESQLIPEHGGGKKYVDAEDELTEHFAKPQRLDPNSHKVDLTRTKPQQTDSNEQGYEGDVREQQQPPPYNNQNRYWPETYPQIPVSNTKQVIETPQRPQIHHAVDYQQQQSKAAIEHFEKGSAPSVSNVQQQQHPSGHLKQKEAKEIAKELQTVASVSLSSSSVAAAREIVNHSPKIPNTTSPPKLIVVSKPEDHISNIKLSLVEMERAERSSESSGAVLALTLGLSITGLLLVLVGCRLRMVRRRLRRGRSPYAHDADYLVNGMYL